MVRFGCTAMRPASTPSKKPSVARPIAPRTMSSICPGGTSLSRLSPNWRTDAEPIELIMLAAHAVGRAVQELLHAARAQVLEQGLAHAGEQQHLEVEEAADAARHLPQQVPGDHVGARRHLADRHRDVAGRFAVADDEHPLAPGLLLVVQFGAGEHPAAGRGELGLARIARHGGLAEHPVGHHERVDVLGRRRAGGDRPAAAGRRARPTSPRCPGAAPGPGRSGSRTPRGRPGPARRSATRDSRAAWGSPTGSTAPSGSAWSAPGTGGCGSTRRRRRAPCRRRRPRAPPA